jgi:hypothetical protein
MSARRSGSRSAPPASEAAGITRPQLDEESLFRDVPPADQELSKLFRRWADAKQRSMEPADARASVEAPRKAKPRQAQARPRIRPRPTIRPLTPPAAVAQPPAPATPRPAVRPQPAVRPIPPPEAAPPAAHDARVSNRGAAIWAIGVVVILAAAALVAITSRGHDHSRVASVAGLAETGVPKGWVADRAVVPGFPARGVRSFAPPGRRSGSSLSVSRITPSATSLLPAALLRRLDQPAPRPAINQRGDAWIYSYTGMHIRGRGLAVHVLLTDSGATAAACVAAPSAPSGFAARCQAAAGSLRAVAGTHSLRGLSAAYARELGSTIAALGRSRAAAERSLGTSATPARALTAARGLEREYAQAAERVSAIAVVRTRPELAPANRRIHTALRRAATAYAGLARALAAPGSPAVAAARGAVLLRERDLRAALTGLAGLGYRPALVR